ARLVGGDPIKNSNNYLNNQQLLVVGTKSKARVIDSLDLENFLHPKEVHIDAETDDRRSPRLQQTPNRRSPFRDPRSNGKIPFTIPELPSGEQLVLNLKTTWGDRHYIGLNGIEIFSSQGYPVPIRKITADPADINVLPEYGNDPRVVKNLIDGVNKTRDDVHMWLAPFTAGQNHLIYITFEHSIKIAMIRIW
ncbi:unnamed protein product, partial [Rotaria sp. Silwood2]